jgi:hypothetical protein
MMFSSNVCRFAFFSFLSLSANADTDTVRGVQRGLPEVETAVPIGHAGNYVILAKTGITNVVGSAVTGNIAVSPITATAMTGFTLIADSAGAFATSSQVTGEVFAASYLGDTPTILTTAVSDMETAYTNAAGRPNPDAARNNYGDGILSGDFGGPTTQLTAGVYTWTTGVHITGNLHFKGTDTDIFIIQIAGNLDQDANFDVVLEAGDSTSPNDKPLAVNIFWQIAGSATVGAGAHMEGILLAKTAVTFVTGSSLNGRVFTQTACNLQMATISQVTRASDEVGVTYI